MAGGGAGMGGAEGGGGQVEFRSPGCDTDAPTLAEGAHTFDLDGNTRRYIIRLPQNYEQGLAWPLVLALHPNGGDLGYWDGTSGSRNLRGHLRSDAVVVVAEAIGGNWRDYGVDESQWPARVELELSYFERVLGDAKDQLCVDQRAIFAIGFSGGGSFSGVLGCRRSDIRAFAAGGSVIYFDPESCIGSAAAWIVLSEEDDTEDRRAYLDFFADRAGCDAADFQEQTCHAYQSCAPESPVTFCHHPGGHDWPDFGVADAWTFFNQLIEH
jgi:poly(3-hydroxybutyrate) depolymerase